MFLAFLKLGVTSFGGPVAHLGYFNNEFVQRRRWVDEDTFAQIVALCQFLPGPASSQAGMIIGLIRGGAIGACLAWFAFTLPSAILLTAFALGAARIPGVANAPWMHGLLIAAVAVVAGAVLGMYRTLCPDVQRKSIAFAAAAIVLLLPPGAFIQLAVTVLGAIYGRFFIDASPDRTAAAIPVTGNRVLALACATVFAGLLILLPIAGRAASNSPLQAFAAFYESGALVFGGGHVVLPLLQERVVPPGWIPPDAFLAGYGAAQAVPGPLFTFAAYLGAAMHGPIGGAGGAALALFAIYLPSFLLIPAVLPFWNAIGHNRNIIASLHGVNAAVVGILLAAFYSPVWINAIHTSRDAAVAFLAFMLLAVWKTPPWIVVGLSALSTQLLSFV